MFFTHILFFVTLCVCHITFDEVVAVDAADARAISLLNRDMVSSASFSLSFNSTISGRILFSAAKIFAKVFSFFSSTETQNYHNLYWLKLKKIK